MDYLSFLIDGLVFCGFAILLVAYMFFDKYKRGEMLVNHKLKKLIGKNGYIIKNFIIECDKEKICRIGSIIISNKGIYAIQTKSLYGTIKEDKEGNWYQINDNGELFEIISNPIKENNFAIFYLKDILKAGRYIPNIVIVLRGDISSLKEEQIYTLDSFKEMYEKLPANIPIEETDNWRKILLDYKKAHPITYIQYLQNSKHKRP